MKSNTSRARTLTAAGLFSALIIVLQVFATFVKFGPVSITLALAPIVVGGALYGRRFGAFSGAVLGLVILFCGLLGWDGGTVLLMFEAAPIPLVILCVGKTTAAGWLAAVVYRSVERRRGHVLLGSLLAGIVCPVVNTGLFVAGMLTVWKGLLAEWAGGSEIITFVLLTLTGINFLIELGVNLLLAAGITRTVKVLSVNHHGKHKGV